MYKKCFYCKENKKQLRSLTTRKYAVVYNTYFSTSIINFKFTLQEVNKSVYAKIYKTILYHMPALYNCLFRTEHNRLIKKKKGHNAIDCLRA